MTSTSAMTSVINAVDYINSGLLNLVLGMPYANDVISHLKHMLDAKNFEDTPFELAIIDSRTPIHPIRSEGIRTWYHTWQRVYREQTGDVETCSILYRADGEYIVDIIENRDGHDQVIYRFVISPSDIDEMLDIIRTWHLEPFASY